MPEQVLFNMIGVALLYGVIALVMRGVSRLL